MKDAMRDTTHDTECWRYHDDCARVLVVKLPIKTVSEKNSREHWGTRSRRTAKQRSYTLACLLATGWARPALPLVITLTRIGGRELDSDNLARALSGVRDGIADKPPGPTTKPGRKPAARPSWVKVDDGSPLIEWRYAQIVGPPAAVLIEIRGPR